MTYRIPFNRPAVMGRELEYVAQAVALGHASGDGTFTARCQELLERRIGAARVLLTPSCTHALELAALLLEIGPGDEVIVPSFTFASTANAFALRGARIVFADIHADTLNIDERLLPGLVTEKTKAIAVVHYAGVGCEMEPILALANERSLRVVEDNAHGLFGAYGSKQLGTFGVLGALSFHETKNISCGEGGALVVNDLGLVERAEILREKGTDRSRFFRGGVDKYTWIDVGSSYLLSDLLAAFLFAQLEQAEVIQRRRREIWDRYAAGLLHWAGRNGFVLPYVPTNRAQAYHMFYLLAPDGPRRDGLIKHLKAAGILSVFHYVPLHSSIMGRRFGGRVGACPVTEGVSARLLRLPFYNDLSEEDQASVIEAVASFES